MLTVMKSFAAFAALALLLPLSQARAADDIGQGVKAFKHKDYKKAASILKDDAERGDQTAQFYMGRMAEDGLGVKKDKAQAIKMYEGSASQGNATASYRLGMMYRDGEGVKKDPEMANRYFYNAAQGGHPEARKIMAKRMKKGNFEMKVTPAQQAKMDEALAAHNKDEDEKAFNLFMDLAKQDVAEAQTWVGNSYHNGEGVQTNYQEAANWGQKAGKAGHPYGAILAAHMVTFHGIPSRDNKEASKWYYTAGHNFLDVDNVWMAKNMLSEIQRMDSNDPNGTKLLKEIQAEEKKAAGKK